MCQRVRCDRCGKPTYVGCGAHVDQVLADVPPAKRCDCPRRPSRSLLDLILRR
jgi:hypothetical protein